MDKVLLACFDFPPNEGIGGRRWAKFAKALANKGIEVHVIKANPATTGSGWQGDIDHDNIHVHSLPRAYPRSISHPSGSILGKIRYRLALRKLQRECKGTIYDVAHGFEDSFRQKALQLIDTHDIKHVIATGAPFNLIYFAAKLKKFRDVKLLVDYRDPWITAQNYGMANLEAARMAEEKRKQDYVFEHADVVTCPNEFLLKEIEDSTDQPDVARASFAALPHFFDQEDLSRYIGETEKNLGLRLVYGGALYLGLQQYLSPFADWLNQLESEDKSLDDQLNIDMYTPHQDQVGALANHVNTHAPIGKAFMEELAKSSGAFIFLADHNKDFLTTKFFELIPFRKPIFFVGAQGHASEFIRENKLGKVIDSYDSLHSALSGLQAGTLDFNENYDIAGHELAQVGDQLISLLR